MNSQVVEEEKKMESGFYSKLNRDPRLLFGGYPSGDHFEYLKSIGVRYFIDLTTPYEKKKLPVYNIKDDKIIYVNFPIRDNFIPYDMNFFNEFIVWLIFTISVMKENELMYIHCKGGHGRSGMVLCCILCLMYEISPQKSIEETTISHNERPLLTPKWKSRLCPSNEIQRIFVDRVYHCHKQQQDTNVYFEMENAFNTARTRMINHQKNKKVLL
jgi:hypothetical protein